MATNTDPASYNFRTGADCWTCPLVPDPTVDDSSEHEKAVSAYVHHVHTQPPSSVEDFLKHILYAPALQLALRYMDFSRSYPCNTPSSEQKSVQRCAMEYSGGARTAPPRNQKHLHGALLHSVKELLRKEYRDTHPGLPYGIPTGADTVIDAKAQEFTGLFTRRIQEAPRSWGEALETWFRSGK